MFDILVLYSRPEDPSAFDEHYAGVHAPLVLAMPLLQEFTWGKIAAEDAGAPYLFARMTYASESDAERSLSGLEGQAAVADVQTFAHAGVQIFNCPRNVTWRP